MITRPAILIPGLIVLYVGLAAVFLVIMPEPRSAFEYLVAGAFAAAVCLMIGFFLYAKSRLRRNTKNPES